MRSTTISKQAQEIIYQHAKSAYPDECCGFLFGVDGQKRTIEQAVETLNSKEGDKRRRFEISAEDYMKAERYALQHDTTLLGVYHSHPEHLAQPSKHDLRQALPFFSYIIVSVKGRQIEEMTSWYLNDSGKFEEEELKKFRQDSPCGI